MQPSPPTRSETFPSPEETTYLLAVAPYCPLPLSPASCSSTFCLCDVPTLNISNKWNPTVCGLLRLAPFTQHRVLGSSVPWQVAGLRSSLWVKNTPQCVRRSDLPTQQSVNIWTVSPCDYCESCCYERSCTGFCGSLGYIRRGEIAGSCGTSSSCRETARWFSTVAAPLCGFQLLHIFASISYFPFFGL